MKHIIIMIGIIALISIAGCNKDKSFSLPITVATDKYCQERGFERSCGGVTDEGTAIGGLCGNGKLCENATYFCYKGHDDECSNRQNIWGGHNWVYE